jgi:hypothetical protein
MANFSRFELEVCLDIPANILAEIPNGQPEALATMSASDELFNFTRAADTTDDYSTIRVHFRGIPMGMPTRLARSCWSR